MEPLDVDRIETDLATDRVGRKILLFRQTASTNDIAGQYRGRAENDGLCVFAEHQTAGRGRQGNRWLAEPGESLLGSVLLIGWTRSAADILTLVSAVATAEAIARAGVSTARIKWPNDVLIGNEKVAGILVETQSTDLWDCVVIGVGINCHQNKAFFEHSGLAGHATSIDLHRPEPVDRNDLARDLIRSLDRWLALALEDRSAVIEAWKRWSSQLGRRVVLEYDRQRFSGHCVGVDPVHGLILHLDRGGVRAFPAQHSHILPTC